MRRLKYIFILVPVFLVFAVIYLIPRLIKVKKIDCKSQFGPCSQTFLEKALSYEGKALKEAKAGLSGYFKSSPFIKEYSFTYKLPDRLVVNIIEAKARYALGNKTASVYCPIDKDGVCLRIETTTNLPLVEIEGNPPNVGDKIDSGQLFALELIYSLFSNHGVKEGKIVEGRFEVEVEGYTVVFSLQGDKAVLLGSLELILSRLKSESKDSKIDYTTVSKIDLRFKNPVLQ